jgi:uncharacterized membrane protein
MSALSLSSSRSELRVAVLAAAAAVFVASWALLHTDHYTAHKLVDTPVYEEYGRAMRAGDVPYRDFTVEYPSGALPVFVAPTFAGGYETAFGWMMAAIGLVCLVLVVWAGAPLWSIAFVAVSPLLLGYMAATRFDFWPAALLTGAVAALLADRHRLGWGLLGAAAVAKLYPLVVVPLALAWTLRRRGGRELAWSAGIAVLVVGLAVVPFLVLAPGGLWDSVWRQASRPLQIESLAASLVTTFGEPAVVTSHGSQNVAGYGTLAAASTFYGAVVLATLWVAFERGPAERERLLRYAAACVCTFVVFGKVLSPQYLIWLVPLVALIPGRRGIAALALLAAAMVATQLWFPDRYWDYVYRLDRAEVVLARNLLLVALLAVLVAPARRRALSTSGG